MMKTKYLSISLLCMLSLLAACNSISIPPSASCQPDSAFAINENHPKAEQIQATMDKYLARGIPGMSVLIQDDEGFWIASGGFADLENGIAMQPCHLNKLGSVTKMMMGALVWQLVQDGELAIDDLISEHIPEVASRIENGEQITVAMLLNHSAGVYDIARDLDYNLAVINDLSRSWNSDQILNFIEGKPATHQPGEDISYSNSHTLLAGLMVEAVSGRPHGELLKERIFDPLGMSQTVYYDYTDDFPLPNLAQGYLDFNNDGGAIQNLSDLNPGSGNAYTGVYSTVGDLYRFMNALLREKTLTTPENLETIFQSMQLADGGSWKSSIGAIHDERRDILPDSIHAYGHAGGDIAYSANLSYYPHNNTIYAATFNYGTNLPSELGDVLNELREELALIMAE
jgi:D-alanyl-D-alanine carboxypeptidase